MREAAEAVVERLQAAGYETYLVGGCVRDLLLEREPEDWDVATAARPEDVQPLFEDVHEVGRHFGVLRVRVDGDWIEVATFRTEGPYSDGRRPDTVQFTDARTDAARRDFTINALFLDPVTGEVHDFVGGRADLGRRVLRAVGDPRSRFAEDALRLLRGIRFACKLGFEIEPQTMQGMRDEATRIRTTSAERIRDELLGILTGPAPRRGIELMQESGVLRVILPEVEALRGVTQSPDHHPEGDVWVHTMRMLGLLRDPSPVLALSTLLHDVGKPATRSEQAGHIRFIGHVERGRDLAADILDRLRVPVRTRDQVLSLIVQHMRFLDVAQMKPSTLRRFVLQDGFDSLLELHRLDAASSRGDFSTWQRCRDEREALEREPLPVRPLITGDDLQVLGYKPGPRLGAILHALVDAQLEGRVADRDAARAWVQASYPVEGEPGVDGDPADRRSP
jgi:poly(A) polymerase